MLATGTGGDGGLRFFLVEDLEGLPIAVSSPDLGCHRPDFWLPRLLHYLIQIGSGSSDCSEGSRRRLPEGEQSAATSSLCLCRGGGLLSTGC